MALLRSRFRGVIHLIGEAEGEASEIELDGEGPEQIVDQMQGFAVPWIKKAVDGAYLRWEEFDPDEGQIRRHRYLLERQLAFEVCADDQGIELLLPRTEDGASALARVWVPLGALAEPGARQRSVLGWTAREPRTVWRYIEIGGAPTLEMTWACEGVYRGWADEVRRRVPLLQCALDGGLVCRMSPHREGSLAFRGHLPLRKDGWLPARRRLFFRQPLILIAAVDASFPDAQIDDDVPVTVEALDFRAILGERTTRLVSLDDLAHRFAAEVLTAEETLLPDEIPAGLLPGLPFRLRVESKERASPPRPGGSGELGVRPAARCRRFLLRPADEVEGYWGQVEWERYPPILRFALGQADPETTPRIARIPNRRATVGWHVAENDDDELLSFTVPHWVPMGNPETRLAMPCDPHVCDYASEVRAQIDGLEERFAIDPSSEIPANRLFLDPTRWRFYDERLDEIGDAEALGEVSGYVRWRRPAEVSTSGGDDEEDLSPSMWAAGSAPVLLIRRPDRGWRGGGSENVLDWGGLYAPEPVPWEALSEVRPEKSARGDLVLTPRAALPAVWISLWGYVERYDRRQIFFHQREKEEVTAWIARGGLDLFPREAQEDEGAGRGFLLRSFSPLYAVRDSEPRKLCLEPAEPRPVLRLGRDLLNGKGPRAMEIADGTFLRYQITEPGKTAGSFGPGRIPGTPLHLPPEALQKEVWVALDAPRRAGYLLSWSAFYGWRFRGFFAHRKAAVELGRVRLDDKGIAILLGDENRVGRRAFRLTVHSGGHRWCSSTPDALALEVTPRMIAEWEKRYYARDRRPRPLADFEVRILRQPAGEGSWVFEFLERENVLDLDPPAGIRLWEPQEGAGEGLLAGVRRLGEDEPPSSPHTGAGEPSDLQKTVSEGLPRKKLLRADDDDDF